MALLLPPNTMSDSKNRSMVDAATVRIHGAALTTVEACGPSFPAEQTTVIPFATAWKAPMAIGSVFKAGLKDADAPIDIDRRSTPSAMASSNPDSSADPGQPSSPQTLYAAILEDVDPPLAVPGASPLYDTPVSTAPAAVDAVWVPWPRSSLGEPLSVSAADGSSSSVL